VSSECSERVLLERCDRPASLHPNLRKEEDEELVESAAEWVPIGCTVAEPEHEDPDHDEKQPLQRSTLEDECDYDDLPRSTTARC
jgi:hypothetical protein